ncbi:LysR family transcriptional regulator [Actinorhabdospora filicis]|uniref:LysR family transcriptional regulator n=1 Tax=Actinorhabdospora filicis TaxID=1785913 RepID=A0A9W6STI9_9ACTN|nr:LysR family transcriptional regulator [Actinorhabdospora filicis]GLZ82068.1 LysR family transcriptional regulator [Actinorhabdospora filicis]
MDLHLLRVLLELHQHGTMRATAEATGYGTSTISVQLAALEKQAGAALLERSGRTVRFTPAGRRLVEHAGQILAAVESAKADLSASGPASGVLRVAGSASALSGDLIPVAAELKRTHPALRLELQEREPAEVSALLAEDAVDLGFVYDFDVVPKFADNGAHVRQTCDTPMRLAVPSCMARVESFAELRDEPWVVNSRGEDDTELVERVCGLAGFAPFVAHKADSLGLVLDFVAADLGVALVPAHVPPREGVIVMPSPGLEPRRRMFAVTRPGRHTWPAIALVTEAVVGRTRTLPVFP